MFESIPYHPKVFENIDLSAVRGAALNTQGSHGPSCLTLTRGDEFLLDPKKSQQT